MQNSVWFLIWETFLLKLHLRCERCEDVLEFQETETDGKLFCKHLNAKSRALRALPVVSMLA